MAVDFAMLIEGDHSGCIGQDIEGSESVIRIGAKCE